MDDRGETTTNAANEEEQAQRQFYDNLRQNGQLVDVDEGVDLSRLPPQVTHVRYPDGRVERVGFA
jgi:hypothetical protein